jgi:hypothetical protein
MTTSRSYDMAHYSSPAVLPYRGARQPSPSQVVGGQHRAAAAAGRHVAVLDIRLLAGLVACRPRTPVRAVGQATQRQEKNRDD